MKSQHTRGPWRVNGTLIEGPRMALEIASVRPVGLGYAPKDEGEAKANARLIGASPDLLEALEAILAKHDDRDALSDLWPAEAAKARDAIAKARGGR